MSQAPVKKQQNAINIPSPFSYDSQDQLNQDNKIQHQNQQPVTSLLSLFQKQKPQCIPN